MKNLLIIILALFLFTYCSSPIQDSNEDEQSAVNDAMERPSLEEAEFRILSLPTPIQLASVFKAYDFEYDESIYTPLEKNVYNSKYQRAVIGGIYATDLGYAIINDAHKESSAYYEHLIDIFTQLGFSRSIEYIERFQENQNIKDSLSHVFMSCYDEMHREVLDYKHDEVAFYLLAGCYIESTHIFIHYYQTQNRPSKQKMYSNILSQQILSLDNLLELGRSVNVSIEEAADLMAFLEDLKQEFSAYELLWKDEELYIENMPDRAAFKSLADKIEAYKKLVL